MLTSIRGLSAATLCAGLLVSAAPAFASETVSEEAKTELPTETPAVSEAPAGEAAISEELLALSAKLDGTEDAEGTLSLSPAIKRAAAPFDADTVNKVGSDEESPISFSANVAITTDYRFRGVSLSDGQIAIQGGFDLSHDSGLYAGTWASSLDETTVGYGSTELDLYGGWSGDLTDGVSADVGVIWYIYPDAGPGNFDYVEFYGSVSFSFGPASITPGIAYAPEQDSLGNTDNFYIYTDLSVGIPDSPITLNGHIGYTDGFLTFTNDSQAVDWSISADVAIGPATLSAAYIGVDGDAAIDPFGTFTDDAFVVTLSASF